MKPRTLSRDEEAKLAKSNKKVKTVTMPISKRDPTMALLHRITTATRIMVLKTEPDIKPFLKKNLI